MMGSIDKIRNRGKFLTLTAWTITGLYPTCKGGTLPTIKEFKFFVSFSLTLRLALINFQK
jgi:hypothetical protein